MKPRVLAYECVVAATSSSPFPLAASTDMCVGVTCPGELDECETRRKTCNRATGLCTAPPKADGTPCSIGSCQGGVCTGGWGPAPRRGRAYVSGRPPYGRGQPTSRIGRRCCQLRGWLLGPHGRAGPHPKPARPRRARNPSPPPDICSGVTCPPGGECKTAGACDPATGVCGAPPPLPDGTPCSIGFCHGGVCGSGRG